MRFLITARAPANSGAPEPPSGDSAGAINCLQPLDSSWRVAVARGGGASFAGAFLQLIVLIRPLPHPADWM